jgi:hypothetical protein
MPAAVIALSPVAAAGGCPVLLVFVHSVVCCVFSRPVGLFESGS